MAIPFHKVHELATPRFYTACINECFVAMTSPCYRADTARRSSALNRSPSSVSLERAGGPRRIFREHFFAKMSSFPDDFAVMYTPQIKAESSSESDTDSESNWPIIPCLPANKSSNKAIVWNHADTMELIKTLSTECAEIWDSKHPQYRDKVARSGKHELLAKKFNTTTEEIIRKIHNLRTQFNAEVRKIKRRAKRPNEPETKRWEYFESLMFLHPEALSQSSDDYSEADSMDPLLYTLPVQSTTNGETVNLELARFQAEEEMTFCKNEPLTSEETPESSAAGPSKDTRKRKKPPPSNAELAVEALARLVHMKHPLGPPDVNDPPPYNPMTVRDDCQVFGDFVAAELRSLRTPDSRIKLRRLIMSSILQIGREDYC